MKFILLLISTIFIVSCSTNKVVKNHGNISLEKKSKDINLNQTNKNDVFEILGPASTKSSFDENIWIYIERKKVGQSVFKLGKRKIKKNNVLVLKFDTYGILTNKEFYDIQNMNDHKFSKRMTQKGYKRDSFVYSFLTSVREKINSPVKRRLKKKTNQQ